MPSETLIDPIRTLAALATQKKTKEIDMNMTVLTHPAPDFTTPDFGAIKSKQNAAWSSGDYAKIGVTLQITGEELAEAADPAPGSSVLDVAAGNGNATLAFARRWCEVTSTDYVESLLEGGRKRAEADGLDVAFQIADAEDLPFADASFDLVVSTFGVMFTPNQQKSAAEMIRACRSGGKIAMANWTPDSFIGALFKTLGRHVPPPAGVASPALWGNRDWIEEQFSSDAQDITMKLKSFNFRYRSPAHFIEFFRVFYGPVRKAFIALDKAGQVALYKDILDTVNRFNLATDGSMIAPSEYAEIIVTKR
ncbi:class I SAM-dependent methyltransferase [Pelagibius sp. Alg239-R121]|uniref:class I SAM-dependent methyltransferase n=1 Tax=Pelagibius sp. Alg239-R121 TaxID=2993448 RepID=UPI002AC357B3|nr:class I SAM-dependent methyltransferase [Pelagibius sp. Alg239-R121]